MRHLAGSLFLLTALAAPATAGPVEFVTVALEGDAAPGEPDGVRIVSLDEAVLNESGDLAFSAVTTVPGGGIWLRGHSGSLSRAVRQGDLGA